MEYQKLFNELGLDKHSLEVQKIAELAYMAGKSSKQDVVAQVAQICANFSQHGGNPDDFWKELTDVVSDELAKTVDEFIGSGVDSD